MKNSECSRRPLPTLAGDGSAAAVVVGGGRRRRGRRVSAGVVDLRREWVRRGVGENDGKVGGIDTSIHDTRIWQRVLKVT